MSLCLPHLLQSTVCYDPLLKATTINIVLLDDEDLMLVDDVLLNPDVNYLKPIDLPNCGIVIHTFFHTLHCLTCEVAVLPGKLLKHLKAHKYNMSADILAGCTPFLDSLILNNELVMEESEVAVPRPGGCPVQGLSVRTGGLKCADCDQVFLSVKSWQNHKGRDHRGAEVGNFLCSYQTFFLRPPTYFLVNTLLIPASQRTAFTIFQTDILPTLQHPDLLPTAIQPRDIPLWDRRMGWDTLFSDIRQSRESIQSFKALLRLPDIDDAEPLQEIRNLTRTYLTNAIKTIDEASLDVRRLLLECPLYVFSSFN